MAGANSGNNNNINSGANDPFEEFEFRPINEGLGFHRNQKKQVTSTSLAQNAGTLSAKMPTAAMPKTNSSIAPMATMKNSVTSVATGTFQSPLPRPEARTEARTETKKNSFQVPTIEDDSIAKAQTAVNEILKNLNHKRQLDFVSESTRLKGEYKKSKPHFFAATLDAMLITAAFIMCLIFMLLITKVDLFKNLTHPLTSNSVYLATFALFMSVTFIYMVVNRVFMGATAGEWAFEQTCGSANEKDKANYTPRVALRTLIVMATGFIVLPILSYLFNKDMAGQIAGVSLFKKPNA
ncbi:MAG: metalloendopeptidase [Bdellovibrionaceae bacterium]|nr:metalloendopeptidase [Bdellovibrio sp.]